MNSPSSIASDCISEAYSNGECFDDPDLNRVQMAIEKAITLERSRSQKLKEALEKIEDHHRYDDSWLDIARQALAEYEGGET